MAFEREIIRDYIFKLEICGAEELEDNSDPIIYCHLDTADWTVAKYKLLLNQAKEAISTYPNHRFICYLPIHGHRHYHSLIKRIGFTKVSSTFNKDEEIISIYLLTDKQKLFREPNNTE